MNIVPLFQDRILPKPPFRILLNSRHRDISPEPGPGQAVYRPFRSGRRDCSFDHNHVLEAIQKTNSTIICKCQWQKHCKQYRKRANGKFSFRNSPHEGDLALFLPTRKSGNGAGFNGMQHCRGIITSIMEYAVELTVAKITHYILHYSPTGP